MNGRIIIDSREPKKFVGKVIKEAEKRGIVTVTESLRAGDYMAGPFIIERKRMSELYSSILSGRAGVQLHELGEYAEGNNLIPVLAVGMGDYYFISKSPQKVIIIYSFAAHIIAETGVSVIFFPRDFFFIGFLMTAAAVDSEGGRSALFDRPRFYRPHYRISSADNPEAEAVAVLSAFPGIGPKTASDLLEHFGTLRRVLSATPKELESVKGVGPKTVEILRKLLDYGYRRSEKRGGAEGK